MVKIQRNYIIGMMLIVICSFFLGIYLESLSPIGAFNGGNYAIFVCTPLPLLPILVYILLFRKNKLSLKLFIIGWIISIIEYTILILLGLIHYTKVKSFSKLIPNFKAYVGMDIVLWFIVEGLMLVIIYTIYNVLGNRKKE